MGNEMRAGVVVIDLGYTDFNEIKADFAGKSDSEINWDSDDRTTWVGAFKWSYEQLKSSKLIMIGGGNVWQNQTEKGKIICDAIKKTAEHYNIPLIDTWNYLTDVTGSDVEPNKLDKSTQDKINTVVAEVFNKRYTEYMNAVAGIENISVKGNDNSAEPVFFDLLGRRVNHPSEGVFVVKQGSRTYKKIIKN